MQMPNKLFSYKESALSKFPVIIRNLENGNCSVVELYKKVQKDVGGIYEYMEALDCLYALGKIKYDDEQEVLQLVS